MNNILLEILISFILVLIASLLSVIEISIASFGAHKIEELKEKKDKSANSFEFIQRNTDSFFGTIQILTTFFLLASALLAYSIIHRILFDLFGDSLVFISLLIDIIIFSILSLTLINLVPKVVGFKYAESIGKLSVKVVIILVRVFHFPVKGLTVLSNILLLPFKERTSFSQTRMSEDEIRIIISEGVETGAIDKTEKKIIENVFEFNDLRANEVMIPRTEMRTLDISKELSEIREQILATKYSLLPVYEESIDNIIGVLHTKDVIKLFLLEEEVNLKGSIRPAYFVPSMKLISEILNEMQKRGERLAIVTDEYGGTEGLITMEDILEEIVGEFGDKKVEQPEFTRMPNGNYTIIGTMDIDDFNETFNYQLPESDDYNTIAGFVAEKTGKILNPGETFQYKEIKFELVKRIRQKMVQFRVDSINKDLKEVPKE